MTKPYEHMIKKYGCMRVQLEGFDWEGDAIIKIGHTTGPTFCVDRKMAETLSNFFGELAEQL